MQAISLDDSLVPARAEEKKIMAKTGYIWDPSFLGHFTSTVHPERPERVEALATEKVQAEIRGLTPIPIQKSTWSNWLSSVHSEDYINKVEREIRMGTRWLDQGDTVVKKDSFDVAVSAVDATLSAVNRIADGTVTNAFAAIRPPGHHASTARARGFCIFNNVAVAARYAQKLFGYNRILIVDWDVHPGDGTAEIFYEDPSVHVISFHQDDLFPSNVGAREQKGKGDGEGTNYNIPLPAGSDETAYLRVFETNLWFAAEKCRPDFILVSCGFDAHRGDPVGGMKLTEKSFQLFTKYVRSVADKYCSGRLLSVLEGGYNVSVLRNCTLRHLESLLG